MVSVIIINGKKIVVETDSQALPVLPPSAAPGLPRGAEPTNFADRLHDGTKLIEDTIGSIAGAVFGALKEVNPEEWSVEIGLAFKGEQSPIQVLVKVGAEASIKVAAKWTTPKA